MREAQEEEERTAQESEKAQVCICVSSSDVGENYSDRSKRTYQG